MRRVLSIILLWVVGCWALIGGFLAPVTPGGWLTILVVGVASLAPLLVLIRGFRGGGYPSARTRLWVFRPFWYVQLFVPILAIAGMVGGLVGLAFGDGAVGGRRAIAAAALTLAAVAVWGFVGARRLVVRELDVHIADLPDGLAGLRIAQISDVHVGPHTSRRFLRRIVHAVAAARPDLVAFTGDQVDDYARDVESFAAAFGTVSAPLGVFAIAGNHDLIAGWGTVRRGLEALGMRVLVNDATPIVFRGARLWIAGTGDPAGTRFARDGGDAAAPDVARTLRDIPPGEVTLALAHNPALWPALAARGVALTLSGHTHHGQLSIPLLDWSLASLFLEHAMGAHRSGASVLYINPGTNFWGIPFRIGALPEVTVLTLRRSDSSESSIVAR